MTDRHIFPAYTHARVPEANERRIEAPARAQPRVEMLGVRRWNQEAHKIRAKDRCTQPRRATFAPS